MNQLWYANICILEELATLAATKENPTNKIKQRVHSIQNARHHPVHILYIDVLKK